LNKPNLNALSAAIALAISASAMGAGISEAQYKSAGQSIAARHTNDQAICESMAGNSKDVCQAEANGRESVAKAQLESSYSESGKSLHEVRLAKANAAYAIANEKCDDAAGNIQDVCRKEAQSVEVAAKADAEKRAAAYAVAREKCDALGEKAQATCIQEARFRYEQS
jgi:hypothetical protein